MSLDVFFITVNWNLKEDTLDCIHSLLKAGIPPEHILIVDNGSNDDSVDVFRRTFSSKVSVIQNDQNQGLAFAYNQGILYAHNKQAQWIMLLNNDIVVDGKFRDEIINTIHSTHNYSILSPIIFYYNKPDVIWSLGDHRIPGTLLTINPYQGKRLNQNLPDIIPMDFISGCAMLVHKNVIDHIGLFDASLFMYGEEVDFCWRAHLAGYRVGSMTKVKIWHKISKSVNKDKPKMRYFRVRNQIRFYRKYSSGITTIGLFTFTFMSISWKYINDVIQRRNDLIHPTFKGWWDGWSFKERGTDKLWKS